MEKELKVAKAVYTVVTALFTLTLLAGGQLL